MRQRIQRPAASDEPGLPNSSYAQANEAKRNSERNSMDAGHATLCKETTKAES
jgi:hypothetical protein